MAENQNCIQRFLSEGELAQRWRRCRRTLQRWRAAGTGPNYHVFNGRILYDLDDVIAFEKATRVVPNS